MATKYDHYQVLKSAAHIKGETTDTLTKTVTDASDEVFFLDEFNPGFNGTIIHMESSLNVNFKANPTLQTPNCGTAADDATVGTVAWQNVDNAEGDDLNTYADTASNLTTGNPSHYLKCTNFGFNIPSGATILGIKVQMDNGLTTVQDNSIKIVKGGTITGDEKATADADSWNASPQTWGGTTDLWGTTWTYSDINNTNFGVAISAKRGSADAKPQAKRITITVYFSISITYKWQIYARDDTQWRDLYTDTITKEAGDTTYADYLYEGFKVAADFSPGQAKTPYFLRLVMTAANSGAVLYETKIDNDDLYQRIFGELAT